MTLVLAAAHVAAFPSDVLAASDRFWAQALQDLNAAERADAPVIIVTIPGGGGVR